MTQSLPARRTVTLVLGGVLTAALAACTSAASPSTGASSGASTGAGGAASPNATGRVDVGAKEFAFDPSTIVVKAGSVTFHVKNSGVAEHEFEIFQGDKVIDEIEGIVPGLEKELKVDLAAGAYTFVCKLPGHAEAGMKGTLTVVG
jgi:iron uptake system component EfeO